MKVKNTSLVSKEAFAHCLKHLLRPLHNNAKLNAHPIWPPWGFWWRLGPFLGYWVLWTIFTNPPSLLPIIRNLPLLCQDPRQCVILPSRHLLSAVENIQTPYTKLFIIRTLQADTELQNYNACQEITYYNIITL